MAATIPPNSEPSRLIQRFVARHLNSPGELGELARQLRAAATKGSTALAVRHTQLWANPTYQQAYREEAQRGIAPDQGDEANPPDERSLSPRIDATDNGGSLEQSVKDTDKAAEQPERSQEAAGRPPDRPDGIEARDCAGRGASTHAATTKLVSMILAWFWHCERNSADIKFWSPAQPPEEYLSALNVLRQYGWRTAIEAGIGFVLHHTPRTELNMRLERVRSDIVAYAARGRAFLLDDHTVLHDRLRDEGDVTGLLPVRLEQVSLLNRFTIPGQSKWKVVLVDLLPSPHAPYVGEMAHWSAIPDLAEFLVPPSSGARTEQQNTSTDTRIEQWDAIRERVAKEIGIAAISERDARRKLQQAGVEIRRESGRVYILERDLCRLKKSVG